MTNMNKSNNSTITVGYQAGEKLDTGNAHLQAGEDVFAWIRNVTPYVVMQLVTSHIDDDSTCG